MIAFAKERLDWLKRQIAQGWQVKAPVIERAASAGTRDHTSAFEFVLSHERGCQVIAVPDCPELHTFLREQALPVVSL